MVVVGFGIRMFGCKGCVIVGILLIVGGIRVLLVLMCCVNVVCLCCLVYRRLICRC